MNVTVWEALLFFSIVALVLAMVGLLAWRLLRGQRTRDL